MKVQNPAIAIIACLCASVTLVAQDSTPRMLPLEAACVTYEIGGNMQNGNSIRCHRDYGYEQYEISNLTISMGGFSQSTNTHNITIGDTIYAINLDTQTGTQTTNPMYDTILAALENESPEELSQSMMGAMGFTPTGATDTIVGIECNVYSSGQLGTLCLTTDGLLLAQSVMGMTTTATQVEIDESGDDANYTLYQNVPITPGPDLSNFNLQDLINNNQ